MHAPLSFFQSLQTPHGRARHGQFLIEGIRHVARAVEEQAPLVSLIVEPSTLQNPFGRKLVSRLRRQGLPIHSLPRRDYQRLTLAAEPQGLCAVVKQKAETLERPKSGDRWLAIESVDSPGNLGTMLRTAEAAGMTGIILLGPHYADPWDPAAVRASMGALFGQRIARATLPEFAAWARANRVTLLGSSPRGLLSYPASPAKLPAALLIGCEKIGLSEYALELCHQTVRIPMHGRGDSLNAAVATGILLYGLFGE